MTAHKARATVLRLLKRSLRLAVLGWNKTCMALGGLAMLMLALAFTRMPFDAHRWLGTVGGLCTHPPEMILVLSGSGMPSGPELMRCEMAANWARSSPGAGVVLALPPDTALAAAMVHELGLKGVSPERITFLMQGRNTREQALHASTALSQALHRPVALVTAPEHMYRSLLTFRKLGFTRIAGAPAFEHALFEDLRYAHRDIGGKRYLPDVSGQLSLRYDFWNRLKLEITCLREYTALAYYRLNGWI